MLIPFVLVIVQLELRKRRELEEAARQETEERLRLQKEVSCSAVSELLGC